jgi:WD40 repeat protein
MKRLTALTLLFLFANLPCIAKPERFVRTGHATSITSIAFSPDGKTIASGSFERTVELWDLAFRKEVGSLQTGRVMSLAWKEQHRLLVGVLECTVQEWDTDLFR